MRTEVARLAFNRGIVSPLGLARADIKRMAMSAETQVNWMPRILGSMGIRVGLQYLGRTFTDSPSRCIPFVFSTNDTARIELTTFAMRVFVDDAVISRPTVATVITNGGFDSSVSGWTDNDESGATSDWITGGYLSLVGNGTNAAIRDQLVSVAAADQGVEHALRIAVHRGPVILRVGMAAGTDEYIAETSLDAGEHSLAFTPTTNFNVRLLSRAKRRIMVSSCVVESGGDMVVATPWATADLDLLTAGLDSQSGDIIFIACEDIQQRKIERRSTRSWSVVRYETEDGPFRVSNVTAITITPSALFGNITLTASKPLFVSTMAPAEDNDGALMRIVSQGQAVTASITAEDQWTNTILVEGTDKQRIFTVTVDEDAVGAATFTLQRSLESATGSWTDVQSWTADVTTPFDDGLDNQLAWYRLGVKTGNYVNGTHTVTLNYTVGFITGYARITGFTSSTVVSAEVLTDLGGTSATDDWAEGAWSNRRGWPTAGVFYEGRLVWSGKNGIWHSVPDDFYSFDDTVEGDSAPISRTIGSGPVDVVNWMLPLQRLILGAQGAEFSVRSSSLDEPLTPTNWNLKTASTQGSSFTQAVKVDSRGIYVGKGGSRVYELDLDTNAYDYSSSDVTALAPELCEPQVVRMAVQRLPDTRVHFVLSDGTAAVLLYDKVEQVLCWLKIDSPGANGLIEDVCVLPATQASPEDQVYYQTRRTISGLTVRFHEKWALESQCTGGTTTRLADALVTYSQAASSTISGLSHLEGQNVVVWDNGKCLRDTSGNIATFTVSGGAITVTNAGASYQATVGMVGLPYTARWKSGRMVQLAEVQGGSLSDTQQGTGLALILRNVHAKGLLYGNSLTESEMNPLPEIENGAVVDPDAIRVDFTTEPIAFPGSWSTDERLCLIAKAPRPCTVLAALFGVEHDGGV